MLDPALAIPPPAIHQAGQIARDGAIAVREEFDAARAKGSVEAWDLFIARHPESPLLAEAARLRDMARAR